MALGAVVIVVVGFLLVNYFKGLDTGTTFPEGASIEKSEPGTTIVTPEGATVYKVKKGDTLWSISQGQYGTGYNWSDIAQANNIDDASQIEEGQALTIPEIKGEEIVIEDTIEEDVNEQVSLENSDKATSRTIAGATYTVVQGDNLWDISVRKYNDGYRWVDLAKENDLLNPNLIHAGNVLRLP